MIPHLRMQKSPPAICHAVFGIHAAIATQPQTGEEFHVLLMCPVYQHGKWIKPSGYEALHIFPAAPLVGVLKWLQVGAETHADFGGKKQSGVSPRHTIYEGVYRRPGHFVHRTPRVLQAHRRIEHEQVVMSSVVEIDRAGFSHGIACSLFKCTPDVLHHIGPRNENIAGERQVSIDRIVPSCGYSSRRCSTLMPYTIRRGISKPTCPPPNS